MWLWVLYWIVGMALWPMFVRIIARFERREFPLTYSAHGPDLAFVVSLAILGSIVWPIALLVFLGVNRARRIISRDNERTQGP